MYKRKAGFFVFYERYKALCELNGTSATGLALELGIGKSTVSGWKKKGTVPSGATLKAIADRLDVSVDYLLTGEEKEKPAVTEDDELAEYLEQLKTRPEMRMLFSLTKGATKEDVERAVRIIEAALGK